MGIQQLEVILPHQCGDHSKCQLARWCTCLKVKRMYPTWTANKIAEEAAMTSSHLHGGNNIYCQTKALPNWQAKSCPASITRQLTRLREVDIVICQKTSGASAPSSARANVWISITRLPIYHATIWHSIGLEKEILKRHTIIYLHNLDWEWRLQSACICIAQQRNGQGKRYVKPW